MKHKKYKVTYSSKKRYFQLSLKEGCDKSVLRTVTSWYLLNTQVVTHGEVSGLSYDQAGSVSVEINSVYPGENFLLCYRLLRTLPLALPQLTLQGCFFIASTRLLFIATQRHYIIQSQLQLPTSNETLIKLNSIWISFFSGPHQKWVSVIPVHSGNHLLLAITWLAPDILLIRCRSAQCKQWSTVIISFPLMFRKENAIALF